MVEFRPGHQQIWCLTGELDLDLEVIGVLVLIETAHNFEDFRFGTDGGCQPVLHALQAVALGVVRVVQRNGWTKGSRPSLREKCPGQWFVDRRKWLRMVGLRRAWPDLETGSPTTDHLTGGSEICLSLAHESQSWRDLRLAIFLRLIDD